VTSARRVNLTCVALLTLGVIAEWVAGSGLTDDNSYRVGYAAASNAGYVRTVMTQPGATSESLCDGLLERALASSDSRALVRRDFVIGCRHAVGDAME
jgi:hypothetical protein